MRYGVLADIHGNEQALRAALESLEGAGVDRYLVAGDLVGYGANPNECVEIVAGLDATTVAGNHDLIATGRLSDARCIGLARQSLRWTREVLGGEARAFLESLPLEARAPGGVYVTHGAFGDTEAYTTTGPQASAQLAVLAGREEDGILVLGHTHRAWAFGSRSGSLGVPPSLRLPDEEALLLNPGSVGQSRELLLRARCMLLDLDQGCATFDALPYDAAGCRDALRVAGLPGRSHHLRPSLARAGARGVRATAGRALRGTRRGLGRAAASPG